MLYSLVLHHPHELFAITRCFADHKQNLTKSDSDAIGQHVEDFKTSSEQRLGRFVEYAIGNNERAPQQESFRRS